MPCILKVERGAKMDELPDPPKRALIGPQALEGDLVLQPHAQALIVFAHGSGSSRRSPRNLQVAHALNERNLGTLLFDLLQPEEALDRNNVFDIELLGRRVTDAIEWLDGRPALATLPLGLFGASTGAAAALVAAAARPERVFAVVSRGGRPDLAGASLPRVHAPTLLIVGGADTEVLALNRHALSQLTDASELTVVPDATHLFEERGALERVTQLAGNWFIAHLPDTA
jgi:pimeloyl-ACP methyl ester carboxylesterase